MMISSLRLFFRRVTLLLLSMGVAINGYTQAPAVETYGGWAWDQPPSTTRQPVMERDPAITALIERIAPESVPGQCAPAHFIRSHIDDRQIFLYDQAATIIALVHAGQTARAEEILNALANTQRADGSWYFISDVQGRPVSRHDLRYSGAIAWVVMAINTYRLVTGTTTYDAIAERALAHLVRTMRPLLGTRALTFNPTNLSATHFDETQLAAFEHNVDFFAALRGFEQSRKSHRFHTQQTDVGRFLRRLWNGHRFHAGYLKGEGINTTEHYLDTQSWGVLALDLSQADALRALSSNCDVFLRQLDDEGTHTPVLHGFSGDTSNTSTTRITIEGTASQILAMRRMDDSGVSVSCQNQTWSALLRDLETLVALRILLTHLPFAAHIDAVALTAPVSAADKAWLYFARQNINPFQPWTWQ